MPDFYTLFLVVLLLGLSHCIIWGLVVYRYRCGRHGTGSQAAPPV